MVIELKKIVIFIFISINIFCKFQKVDIEFGSSFYAKEREMHYEESVLQNDSSFHANNNSKSAKVDVYKPLLKVENHIFYLGFGVRLEEALAIDSQYGNLNYLTPLYFSTLYLKKNEKINFYGKFNIGYEFAFEKGKNVKKFDGDNEARVSGGMHFGIESGIEYKNILLGLNYNQSSTKLLIPSGVNQVEGKVDREFSTIALVLGYRFDI